MANLPQVLPEPKDKKISVFSIETCGTAGGGTRKQRIYLKDKNGQKQFFWAYYRSLSGGEYFSANSEQKQASALFSINQNKRIKSKMYIEFRGEVYNILFVDPLEGYAGDMKIYTKLTQEANGIKEADSSDEL